MRQQQAITPLPRWLVVVGSLAIVYHLVAITANALAAPSGPWPNADGPVGPPLLARNIHEPTAEGYLNPLHLGHNYHLLANQMPSEPGIYFTFKLFDEAGKEVATGRIPDPAANRWVAHRQSILAQALGNDPMVQAPPSEIVPAPNRPVPRVRIWDMVDGRLQLRTVDVNQIPRDRPTSGPSDLSLVLAESYARYLCRTHGAAKATITRHHQEPIPPMALSMDNVPARMFDEIPSDYGEFSK